MENDEYSAGVDHGLSEVSIDVHVSNDTLLNEAIDKPIFQKLLSFISPEKQQLVRNMKFPLIRN